MTDTKTWALWHGETPAEEEAHLLRMKAKDLSTPFTEEDRRDIERVVSSFLERDDAAGLAAPQIGISKNIIVFRNRAVSRESELGENEYDVLINPRITQISGDKIKETEGCLSCPDLNVDVVRHDIVRVKALDREGKKINKRYTGFIARVAQHEIDHLNGTLIIDKGTTVYYPKEKEAFFSSLFKKQ